MKVYKVTYLDFENKRKEVVINAENENDITRVFFENFGGFLLFSEEMKGEFSYE